MKYGSINIDKETMGGTPVFLGTRVPVQTFFDYLVGGNKIEDFIDDYPSVTQMQAVEVLEMAKKTLTIEKILNENFA